MGETLATVFLAFVVFCAGFVCGALFHASFRPDPAEADAMRDAHGDLPKPFPHDHYR